MATPLSLSTAYLLCIACVLLDALARAQRLCILVRASGGTLPLTAALGANLVEDAGAGLTPMRVGGAPARLVILCRWGVDLATGVMITIVEVIVAYVPVLLTGAVLAYFFARNWWLDVGGGLRTSIGHFLPWLVLGVAFGALGWQAMRKLLPRHHRWARRTLARARRELRDAGPSAVFWSFILSLLSAGARLAILPLLTLTVSSPPPWAWLSSPPSSSSTGKSCSPCLPVWVLLSSVFLPVLPESPAIRPLFCFWRGASLLLFCPSSPE